jgi:hypothetical protein
MKGAISYADFFMARLLAHYYGCDILRRSWRTKRRCHDYADQLGVVEQAGNRGPAVAEENAPIFLTTVWNYTSLIPVYKLIWRKPLTTQGPKFYMPASL